MVAVRQAPHPAPAPFAKIRAIRVKVFSPICVYRCPSVVKNWLQIGFKLALKWLYLALFGFVFYRQNRHFTSVKSGDSCIFKMGLFRNFMFF